MNSKKETPTEVFYVTFAKFLRILFLQNISSGCFCWTLCLKEAFTDDGYSCSCEAWFYLGKQEYLIGTHPQYDADAYLEPCQTSMINPLNDIIALI